MMAGYLSLKMPPIIAGLSKISPVTWGSIIVSNLAFGNITFSCDSYSPCEFENGQEVLELYNMNTNNKDFYKTMTFFYVMLLCIGFAYFILALLAVLWKARILTI